MDINKTKLIHNLQLTFKDDSSSSAQLWVSIRLLDFRIFVELIFGMFIYVWIFFVAQSTADHEIVDMDKILGLLAERIIETKYTEAISRRFEDILPLILMENVNFDAKRDTEFFINHRRKCIALAKLISFSSHAQRFAFTYFAKMPSPFSGELSTTSRTKCAKTTLVNDNEPSKLDILKCSYTFLKFNTPFFVRKWKWSELIERYGDFRSQNEEYKLVYNHILALLTGMTHAQLAELNGDIPIDVEINFVSQPIEIAPIEEKRFEDAECFKWNLKNELFTNVEGVLLPIFNSKNAFSSSNNNNNRIVMVDSARQNLRSIAIGVAAGKAVCLSGSVGSGKTTLIEYLAYKTGRIPIKQFENDGAESKENSSIAINNMSKSNKRKAIEMEKTGDTVVEPKSMQNGFLRIQLGDQTDSKMLLGQYHCTDVPGEFVWQPGVLTQAVMNGYWLLLEDLDQCSRDVSVMLTNFFENNYLSVPGFRDCIQISSDFQLFVTRRYVVIFFFSIFSNFWNSFVLFSISVLYFKFKKIYLC